MTSISTNYQSNSANGQWGVYSIGGDVWSDLPFNDLTGILTLTPGVFSGGIVFDAMAWQTYETEVVGGVTMVLEAPLLTGFSLSFAANRTFAGTHVLEVGLVTEPIPANYTNGNGSPWNRSETLVTQLTLTGLPASPAVRTYTITFDSEDELLVRSLMGRGFWSGRLAFSLRAATGSPAFRLLNGPTVPFQGIAAQETQWFSGLAGGPDGPRLRVVRDGRYGMPILNTQAVRDGDNPSLWVRSEDFDPEDEEQTYRPRPGEGTVDDQIPEG